MRMKEQYRRKPNQEVLVVGLATSGGQSGFASPSFFCFVYDAMGRCGCGLLWSRLLVFWVAGAQAWSGPVWELLARCVPSALRVCEACREGRMMNKSSEASKQINIEPH